MKECPDCRGAKVCVISCCTGDVITDDWQMCSVCHEHLGEDTCELCSGTGEVEDDEEGSDTYDAQLVAENIQDLNRGL